MHDFYGTFEGANNYHILRGNTAWMLSDEDRRLEAMLRGSEWIDSSFRGRFPGFKAGLRAQVREWPRTWAYDIDGNPIPPDVVPVEAEHASYEAALRELTSPGSLSPDFVPGRQQKRVRVDVIEVEYVAQPGIGSAKPILSVVGGIIAPILTGSPSGGSTVRV